jgi:hypothetical protein
MLGMTAGSGRSQALAFWQLPRVWITGTQPLRRASQHVDCRRTERLPQDNTPAVICSRYARFETGAGRRPVRWALCATG